MDRDPICAELLPPQPRPARIHCEVPVVCYRTNRDSWRTHASSSKCDLTLAKSAGCAASRTDAARPQHRRQPGSSPVGASSPRGRERDRVESRPMQGEGERQTLLPGQALAGGLVAYRGPGHKFRSAIHSCDGTGSAGRAGHGGQGCLTMLCLPLRPGESSLNAVPVHSQSAHIA